MASFNNMKAINDYVKNCLVHCMNVVGEEIKRELENIIEEYWYNGHTAIQYDRTMQLLHAIDFNVDIVGDTVQCKVYFDEKKMDAIIVKNGWNKHASIHGEDVRYNIDAYINFGNGNSTVYRYGGINWVDKITEYAEKRYKYVLKEEMQSRYGITIK